VRILFTFKGGPGHLEPLLPLVAAAGAAGHEIAVAGRPPALDPLAARGVTVFATEAPRPTPRKRIPLQPVDVERERRDFSSGFAGRAGAGATAIVELSRTWRPDAIVADNTDFGGQIGAERLDLPCATVLVLAARAFLEPEDLERELAPARAEHGLPPGPAEPSLVLAPFPAAYRDPLFPLPPTALYFRPSPVPERRPQQPPLVYFTLGTEFNVESGDLFQRVVAGLRELPAEVVVTVGRDIDPAELGPQPAHVRVEEYVPQAEILARASLCVSHGGSGSVLGALLHGVPMVLLPMGADQPFNATRCEALGVAHALDVIAATPGDVRDAAAEVLAHPSYREAAEAMRDEFAALPGPESAVALLERTLARWT
jgi:UDP:flavonoid glycosyltransferase YjiC (YdhE family)